MSTITVKFFEEKDGKDVEIEDSPKTFNLKKDSKSKEIKVAFPGSGEFRYEITVGPSRAKVGSTSVAVKGSKKDKMKIKVGESYAIGIDETKPRQKAKKNSDGKWTYQVNPFLQEGDKSPAGTLDLAELKNDVPTEVAGGDDPDTDPDSNPKTKPMPTTGLVTFYIKVVLNPVQQKYEIVKLYIDGPKLDQPLAPVTHLKKESLLFYQFAITVPPGYYKWKMVCTSEAKFSGQPFKSFKGTGAGEFMIEGGEEFLRATTDVNLAAQSYLCILDRTN
jgi:hypothetical protein